MTEPIVVVGAGGFGRETLDVLDAINVAAPEPVWQVLGVVDDFPAPENLDRLARRGVAFLGTSAEFLANNTEAAYVIGIGSPAVRRTLANRLDEAGLKAATLIHPAASLGFDVEVGLGSVICAGARLTTNIRLGRHTHMNLNATIGHDAVLGDFVSLNPLASVSGDCVIEDDVLIGVAGVVLNQLTVGQGAVVGGSACVVRNVPAGATVKGVPAR